MKLNIPFYKSEKDTECGQRALQMALMYFNRKYTINNLSKLTSQADTGITWSLGIAVAAKKLGFNVKFMSSSNFDSEKDEIEYYKNYADKNAEEILEKLKSKAKKLKINIEEKNLSLKDLESFINKNSVPIVLINWFAISGKTGFSGHFVAVSGYDKENIYIHNPGIANAMAFMPVKKQLFKKAWESKGTDKDTIIISKN